ncbi:MAG: hypothetical protein AB1898_11250 [Acidobacteriota bacterium]
MHPLSKITMALAGLALVSIMGVAVRNASPMSTIAAEKVSKRALKEMITGAKSAADHKAIANYYYEEAAKARASAVEHDEMAAWYRKAGEGTKKTPYAPGTIDHCERLVKNYKASADDLTALAKEHEAMAAKAK